MARILALQKLDTEPENAFICVSVSWSDWSAVTD